VEQITKTVQEIGNGGHIYLPKETVGKRVVITLKEKTIEDIEEEIIDILRPYLKHIQGIYIHGSYARNEQTPESDIDILVITDGKIRIKKKIREYEIISVSEKQIKKTIGYTASLILPILKEAKPILNQGLIEKYKKERLNKKNTKWYIETTKSSLELSKEYISLGDKESIPNILYPLIMRLRGLVMIKCSVNDKPYSNKLAEDYLTKKGLSSKKIKEIIRIYMEHREDKKISPNSIDYEDINKLHKMVYEYYAGVEKLWAKLN